MQPKPMFMKKTKLQNVCQAILFEAKTWHGFYQCLACVLTNLCQSCAKWLARVFEAKTGSHAKRVPSRGIGILETSANANPYIGVAFGMGFENRVVFNQINIKPFCF